MGAKLCFSWGVQVPLPTLILVGHLSFFGVNVMETISTQYTLNCNVLPDISLGDLLETHQMFSCLFYIGLK